MPPQAKRVFKGVIFDVYQWQQQMYDGSFETFERLKRPDTVQVIAVKDDNLVVLEQQQPDRTDMFYDVPSGRNDIEAEDELAAAKRELLEETGMTFKTWRLVNVKQPHAKIDWLVYTFLATDFDSQSAPQTDNGERITVKLVPFAEAKAMLASDTSRFKIPEIVEASSLDELLTLPEYTV